MLHTIRLDIETQMTAENARQAIMIELNVRNREVNQESQLDVIKATIAIEGKQSCLKS